MLGLSTAHYAFLRLRRIYCTQFLLLQSCLYPINDLYAICRLTVINSCSCDGEAEPPFKINCTDYQNMLGALRLTLKYISKTHATVLK
jgi:hypothetical protein